MRVLADPHEVQQQALAWRAEGVRIGVVPTMGFLHAGHLALVDLARKHADRVIVTVFVNPTQFGAHEDLDRYPVDREGDLAKCEARGADLVFWPEAGSMYHPDASVSVEETRLSRRLCGTSRPGHFSGVCLVVTKLFNLTQPHVAVFGEKDGQQLRIVRRLVRDLDVPVTIESVPTVREEDGLAMSSRNAYLTDDHRAAAPGIRATLQAMANIVADGGHDAEELVEAGRERLATLPGARLDYLEIVDNDSLEPVDWIERPVMIAAAVYFGETRLIDNIVAAP